MLTFKPRGWRGKDAYEILGQVMDGKGRRVYEIAGRWNSQLIMRKAGEGGGVLNPDTSVSVESLMGPSSTLAISSSSSSSSSSSTNQDNAHARRHGTYILLWKNSVKLPQSPFNLTPFAITLNDVSSLSLRRPFLPPTDCRLRPDQRAFEMGEYDAANGLKMKQEEKQRKTKREREMGVRKGHEPRWFESGTCGDTGERVWMPKKVKVRVGGEGGVEGEEERVEYWVERERVWNELKEEKKEVLWRDVEDIFIDEPEVVRRFVLG